MKNYQPAIKYGVYLGLIGVLIHLITYAIDAKLFLSTGYGLFSGVLVGLAAPIVFMILGARDSKVNFGNFNFGKAFASALLVGVVATLISLGYTLLFNGVIDTELADWMYEQKMDEQIEKMEAMNYDEATIEKSMNMAAKTKPYTTGALGALIVHGVFLFWYLILALIIGAVQKDKQQKDLIA